MNNWMDGWFDRSIDDLPTAWLTRSVLLLHLLVRFESSRPKGEGSCDDEETYVAFYKSVFDGLTVTEDENKELYDFFDQNKPSKDFLVTARAMAFKAACDYISDDKAENVKLLKCINVAVHAFEKTCLV